MNKKMPEELKKMFEELCEEYPRTGKKSECKIYPIKEYIKENLL